MSYDGFLVAIKSTIDKRGNDLAQAQTPAALFVDLDDSTATEAAMASVADAVIWEFGTLQDDPRDPLYLVTFSIGARTTDDVSNYDIMRLTGKVRDIFHVGDRLTVKDYSGAVASGALGSLIISDVAVMHQSFDRTSGMRLVTVTARAQRAI